MKHVLTVMPLTEEHKKLLQAVSPELEFFHAGSDQVDQEELE